jgi:hypothetical protein
MMVIRSLLNICILGLIVLNSYFWGLSALVLLCLFDDAYLWREEREERERERAQRAQREPKLSFLDLSVFVKLVQDSSAYGRFVVS